MTQTLETLYSQFTGHAPESMEALPGAGSNRSYYRLKGTPTLIGVCGTSREENEAFIYLSRHFQAQHLPVPAVHAVSNDGLCYLQDDRTRKRNRRVWLNGKGLAEKSHPVTAPYTV